MLSLRNTPLLYIEKRYSPLLLPTGLHDWFPRSCFFRSPISMEWKTFGIVICVDWLMTNDVEHSYMHFLVSWLPSFLKCLGILLTCCIEILIWKKKLNEWTWSFIRDSLSLCFLRLCFEHSSLYWHLFMRD